MNNKPTGAGLFERTARIDTLKRGLMPSRLPRICDVGANPALGHIYTPLIERGLCEVHGFEPDNSAYQKLIANRSPHEHFYPVAVGHPGRRPFYLHRLNVWSSLFPISTSAMAELGYPEWASREHVTEIELETVGLDEVEGLPPIDILKMDLQGGELEVLETGTKKLADAVAIITETRFFRFYEDEPMFADQDAALERLGFRLHKFVDFNTVRVPNRAKQPPAKVNGSQLVDADAAYLPKGNLAERLNNDQAIFLAVAADVLFDSPDLTLHCLDILLDRRVIAASLIDGYLACLHNRNVRPF